jgi:hypothetical protein
MLRRNPIGINELMGVGYYFHRIANGREKNTIQSLESDGVLVEGTRNLLNLAIDYYKELFGPALENLF